MKRKPIVGETLYSLNVGNAAHGSIKQVLTPVQVKKVGRKYFTCNKSSWGCDGQYHIGTWDEKHNGCRNSVLYESEQEWLEEKEAGMLHKQLHDNYFSNSWHPVLSLATLRAIAALIEEGE